MSMDWKQRVLRFIEPLDIIHLRSLDKLPSSIIGPAMIFTPHNQGISLRLLEHGKSSVTTNIVERTDIVVLTHDEDERVASDAEGSVRPGFLEMRSVSGI